MESPPTHDAAIRLPVVEPFRLDLTARVLRRLSTNIVDVLAPDGTYFRTLTGLAAPVVVRVRQDEPDALSVRIEGAAGEEARALALVTRMLGVERDVRPFARAATKVPWLRALARRMRGVKPPRYPTLWEACVNAIVFQQISLHAASAILRRVIVDLGERVVVKDIPEKHRTAATVRRTQQVPSVHEESEIELYAFPTAATFAATDDAGLGAAGLSRGKIATLRRIAAALLEGSLDEAMLEERASPEASEVLCAIKGIGAWTAAIILLRGLGRLDIFPLNDSGAARSLALASGGEPVALADTLERLGAQRGMLYYHLLLARLEASGDLPS